MDLHIAKIHSESQELKSRDLSGAATKLLRSVHAKDITLVEQCLHPRESAAKLIHEIDFRLDPQGSTILSSAIKSGEENIIRTLLDCCEPLTLKEAVSNDHRLINSQPWSLSGIIQFPEWWSSYQSNDPSSIALRALLETEGDGESILGMIIKSGLNLKDAKCCDIGRSLWFWAARKGYCLIIECFLESDFPVDLCSSKTGYHHWTSVDQCDPSLRQRRIYDKLAPPGTNAMWSAAYTGNIKLVELLVQKGVCIRQELKEQRTITSDIYNIRYSIDLFLAACHGFEGEYYSIKESFLEGRTAKSHSSFSSNFPSVIMLLLDNGFDPNPTPSFASPLEFSALSEPFNSELVPVVIRFARIGLWAMVKMLLEKGADMQAKDNQARSIAHFAAREPDPEILQSLLLRGFDVNISDMFGYNLLHEAIYAKSYRVVKFLIQSKININAPSKIKGTALLLAIESLDLQMVKMLLDAGANADQGGPTLAELNVGLEERYSQGGRDTKRSRVFASTPLIAAVCPLGHRWDSLEDEAVRADIVSALLLKGADPVKEGMVTRYYLTHRNTQFRKTSGFGVTYPITVAVLYRRSRCFRLLVDASGPRMTRFILDDAMCAACECDYVFTSKLAVIFNGEHLPLNDHDLRRTEMETLLDLGADPNVIGARRSSPLHIACLASQSNTSLINKLFKLGAQIDFTDATGKTALHYAAVFCPDALPILPMLSGDNASLYATDDEGWTVFHYACAGPRGFISQSVEQLKPRFRDAFFPFDFICRLETEETLSVLEFALDTNDKVWGIKNLVWRDRDTGMNPVHISCKNRLDKPLQLICQNPRDMNIYAIQTSDWKTPLILAASANSVVKIRLLLQGMNLAIGFRSEVIKRGKSRQYYLDEDNPGPAENNYSHIDNESDDNEQQQQQLLSKQHLSSNDSAKQDNGTSKISPNKKMVSDRPLSARERSIILNSQTQYGWTALHYAASYGNSEMVRLLIAERNIDLIPPQTRAAPSPLELAKASGNPLCVTILKEALIAKEQRKLKKTRSKTAKMPRMDWCHEEIWKSKSKLKPLLLGIRGVVILVCVAFLYQNFRSTLETKFLERNADNVIESAKFKATHS